MIFLLLLFLVMASANTSAAQSFSKDLQRTAVSEATLTDSVIMKDTLVQSYYRIEHHPLRAAVEPEYGRNWYRGSELPESLAQQNCDYYDRGTGYSLGLILSADIPAWGDASRWSWGPEVFADLSRNSFTWMQSAQARPASVIENFSIRHEIAARFAEAGFGAAANYRILPEFGQSPALLIHGGLRLGYLFGKRYDEILHMVEVGNTFSSGVRDTTVASGPLPETYRLVPTANLGVSFELPLSAKLRMQPSVDLQVPLLGITKYWKGFSVVGGLNLLLDLTPRYETVPVYETRRVPVYVSDQHISVPPHDSTLPPSLTASIEAMALDKQGNPSKVVQMLVEEVRTRNAYPILNYIFFDEASSEIPVRYVQYASPEEAIAKFQGSSERSKIKLLDLYHETLNILGARLKKLPEAHITLTGSTSNFGVEAGKLDLARKRAETVRDYLVRIWQIDPKRIKIVALNLPKSPSPVKTESGREENRRVEIAIDNDSALDPIMVTNIEHLATPDQIVLQPTVSHPITSYSASIHANGIVLQTFSGDTSGSTRKIWTPTENDLKHLRDSLLIEYDVTDSLGNKAHAHSSIPLSVTKVTSDRKERVQRFSLILFDFDQSKIEPRNEKEIDNIASMLPYVPVNKILIQGYTDESGEATHNDELSEGRALEVRAKLQEQLRSKGLDLDNKIATEGRGSRDALYDNRLPEGRFFSRTVNITVERSAK